VIPPAPNHVPTVASQAGSIETRLYSLLSRVKAIKSVLHNTPEASGPISTLPAAATCLYSTLMRSSDGLTDVEIVVSEIEKSLGGL